MKNFIKVITSVLITLMLLSFVGCKKTTKHVEKEVELAPPWITFARETACFFDNDKEVKVDFDENNLSLNISTATTEKGTAIQNLMGTEKYFGNIKLDINVIPGNKKSSCSFTDDLHNALYKNKIFTLDKTVEIFSATFYYIGFKKELVQFPNDDISQYYLVWNGTYEQIASDIFINKPANINFCTDIK